MKNRAIFVVLLWLRGMALAECPSADLTNDCRVNLADLAVMAVQWLDKGSYILYVKSAGAAQVAIDSSTGHGGTTNYELPLLVGTDVTLTAPPVAADVNFVDWTGAVNSSDRTISLSMEADRTVTARYIITTTNMVWIDIDDPGVSGHEGFSGQMSKYETTNAQYCQFLNEALALGEVVYGTDYKVYGATGSAGENPYAGLLYCDTSSSSSHSSITFLNGTFVVRTRDGVEMSNHPMVRVSWYGASAFCRHYGWRLPGEWEWQAVADYHGDYTYGCGTTIDCAKANYNWCNPVGLYGSPYTSHVNFYPPCGYGLCDMAGNVYEWTSSCYYPDCDQDYHVFRGGAWNSSASYCTVFTRQYAACDFTDYFLGFRVCR